MTIQNAREQALSLLERLRDRGHQLPVPTGLDALDDILAGGLRSCQLMTCGGQPGSGKTSFGLQTSLGFGRRGVPAVYLTAEMTADDLLAKVLASEIARPVAAILDGDPNALADAFEVLDRLPLEMLYFERAPRGADGFVPGTRRLVADVSDRHGLAPFLVFDYLQKLDAGHVGPKDDERMRVSRSSAGVAELTRELGTTTFVISSINRVGYRSEPSLDVFKETGSIEFDSDIAMLLRWPEKKPNEIPPADVIELWVLKNRYGRVPTGPIQLIFDGRLGSFRSPRGTR
ncbi:MAG: DnaB-like helicase C-terminal domain-containing protein [Acidimicrobiales bacterium]|jgi:replicative DNA helicase